MKAVSCTNAKLEVIDLPTPTPAKGQLLIDVLQWLITGTVGLPGVEAAFDALSDPAAHAKILIDPKSERKVTS